MSKELIKRNHHTEKKIIMYDGNMVDGKYIVYDGKKIKKMLEETKKDVRKNPYNYSFILIRKDKRSRKSMQDEYKDFIEIADELKKETNGKINMYKTGMFANTAKCLLGSIIKYSPECISSCEIPFLNDSGNGLRIGEAYKGPLYKYDFSSFYPTVYSSPYTLFPIKKGKLFHISDDELKNMEHVSIGLYFVRVWPSKKTNIDKCFWFNPVHKYSHYEINYARELGLEMEMIEKEYNCILYNREDCVTGSQMFGEYFNYLYELKERGVRGAKNLLNCIWGALGQKNCIKYIHDSQKNGVYECGQDYDLISCIPLNESMTKFSIEKCPLDKYYETNYARVLPFIVGKARVVMGRNIQPHAAHVKYCHTDSIVSTKKLDINTGRGKWKIKYEGYCPNAQVINKTRCMGDFT